MPIRWEFSRFFSMTTLLKLVLVTAWFGVLLNGALAADSNSTYQVRQGDSVFEVMRKTGIPVNHIISLNQLPAPYHLRVGQVLTLKGALPTVTHEAYQPDLAVFYVVKAGDAVYEVTRKTGIPAEELIYLNQLPVPYYIHAGQILKLRGLGQGIII